MQVLIATVFWRLSEIKAGESKIDKVAMKTGEVGRKLARKEAARIGAEGDKVAHVFLFPN